MRHDAVIHMLVDAQGKPTSIRGVTRSKPLLDWLVEQSRQISFRKDCKGRAISVRYEIWVYHRPTVDHPDFPSYTVGPGDTIRIAHLSDELLGYIGGLFQP
jgi:hypothetical protein